MTTPPPAARGWILAWALAQGLALWLIDSVHQRLSPALLSALLVFVLALPLTLQMLAAHRARARLGALAAALGGVLALAAAYAAHQTTQESEGRVLVLLPLLAGVWFVLLPFAEQRLRRERGAHDYAYLFATAWRHAFQLLVAGLFTGLFWALLFLLAGLFSMLGVEGFHRVFGSTPFICLATPLAFGLGLALYAAREEALTGFWRALLGVLGWLLPLACLIALMFLAALPVRGLALLWATGHATQLMLGLVAGVVFFFNVAWSDGEPASLRQGPWLRRFIGAGLLTLPVYVGLCVHALALRVAQHGWSVDRLWAALGIALLAVYAVGYAAAAVRCWCVRGAPWMGWARRVNVAAAWWGVALALLTCTPVLDPVRIAVRSQVARLEAQRVAAADFDFSYLRWEAGRPGRAALERLRAEQAHPQAALIRTRAEAELSSVHRYATPATLLTEETLRARLRPYGAPIDPAWLAAAVERANAQAWRFTFCTETEPCALLAADLDGDGQPEQVLIDSSYDSRVFARRDGQWRGVARLEFPPRMARSTAEALLEHGWSAQPPRWSDLVIGGERFTVLPQEDEDNRPKATPP